MNNINILAVLVAAASSFIVGGLWYSNVLFGAVWRREAGDLRKPGEGHPAKIFGLSFVFAFVSAVAYALLVPAPSSALLAVCQGLLVGAAIVGGSFGVNYQFANRSTKLWIIDAGYTAVQFALYGLIIGLWR